MESNLNVNDKIIKNRSFMRSNFAEDDYESDQQKQIKQPDLTKPANGDIAKRIMLSKNFEGVNKENDYMKLLEQRKSCRVYKNDCMTLNQLSFLLWSTQGVKEIKGDNYATIRCVPSGGARHPFETYLAVLNIEGLEKGIYHYLPIEHSLEFIGTVNDFEHEVAKSLCDQKWAVKSAVVFFYSVIPYRCEWRYTTNAHKVMLIDAGHVMQNLYLSSQSVGCGTCAIAAYDQELVDDLLQLDGVEEFVVYVAPVGVI